MLYVNLIKLEIIFSDVNECLTQANQCKFNCKNLIGTFLCTCPDGYRQLGRNDDCEGRFYVLLNSATST